MAVKEPIDIGRYLVGWTFEHDDIEDLRRRGRRVTPEEFEVGMKGHLFCNYCGTQITRRPLEEPRTRNGKPAYFAHIPSYGEVPCDRRVLRAPGNNFEDEENARQAIERGDLVVVRGFARRANQEPAPAGQYVGGAIEDPNGPRAQMPIARHRDREFEVEANRRAVAGICANLDEQLHKYYELPGLGVAQPLSELLQYTASVQQVDAIPRLYFGKIKTVEPFRYVTVIKLDQHRSLADFAIRAEINEVRAKGFHAGSVGQYAMVWGPVRHRGEGIGLAVLDPDWGEYALVSPMYTAVLDDLAREKTLRRR